MKVSQKSRSNRKPLTELLEKRGFEIVEESAIVFLEKGLPLSDNEISIVFNPVDIDGLLAFIDSLKSMSKQKNEMDIVTGKREDAYQVIQTNSVMYFSSDGNSTFCKADNQKFEINRKLYELERDLSIKGFVRVNKSYVVNILKLKEIAPWFGGRLLLLFKDSDDEIEVSRRYVASFKEFLGL